MYSYILKRQRGCQRYTFHLSWSLEKSPEPRAHDQSHLHQRKQPAKLRPALAKQK